MTTVAVLGGGYVLVAADKLADREDDYLFRNAAVVLALSAATPPMQALADYAAKRPLQDEAPPAGRPPPKPGTRPRNAICGRDTRARINNIEASAASRMPTMSSVGPSSQSIPSHLKPLMIGSRASKRKIRSSTNSSISASLKMAR